MVDVEGGSLIVETDASFENSNIVNGTVSVGGNVKNISFSENSNLDVQSGATLTNTDILGNTSVNIADYSSLIGSLTVGKDVTGLIAANLFNAGTGLTNLTLSDGLNPVFSAGIINQDTDNVHNLTLSGGSFNPAEISGWKNLNLSSADLVMESDIALTNNGTLSINSYSNLFVSGNKTIQLGNLNNNGVIDLVRDDSSADNSLTIDGDYVGGTGSKLNLNVDVENQKADKIIITGNASGSTNVYLSTGNETASLRDDILFAEEQGDTSGENVFNIHRVEGSYYQWNTVFENNKWYASIKEAVKDEKYILVPEAAAYYGLIDNTFMQTSSLGENLRNNIALSEYQKVQCKDTKRGANAICHSNRPTFSGWIAPASTSITVDSPYAYDANITGFDGGLDLLSNGYTKLGLLASYRNGVYNYEENGEKYEIKGQAENTISSYLFGAYLRHDGQNWSTILAGYAGFLDVDVSTDDDVKASTSGTTYGATLDISYIYKNVKGLRIEPGVRISYTAVEVDSVEDTAGKTQEFDNASRTEVEAGIKFAKRWDFPDSRAEIFVKPSVVHIMNDMSEFALDEKNSLAPADDITALKVSAGASFDMTSSLCGSITGSYSLL